MPVPDNQSTGVSRALQEALENFVANNSKSAEVFHEASSHLPGGNTRTTLFTTPFPLAIQSASGSYITSIDGKTYLDLLGEYTAGIYGHSHPTIVNAIKEALATGVNFGATSPAEGQLASLIKKRFEKSAGLELLRFTNSGTEANLMAVATARAFTGRPKILVFQNAYHGSLQSWRGGQTDFPTNIPGEYLLAKYNDQSSVEEVMTGIPADSLAAVLVEPMQGASGSLPASPAFLRFLRQKTEAVGALLIFDEVMTSRLHWDGGLSGKMQIRPDLMTMGKYLGGGMSFGLFGGRRDVMSLYHPISGGCVPDNNPRYGISAPLLLAHSGTFNNNVVTMHAGIAGAGILTKEVLDNVNELGESLRRSLSKLLVSRGIIGQLTADAEQPNIDTVPKGGIWVSGIGSLLSIHFGVNDELHDLRDLYWFYLLEHGFYIARRGFIALNIQVKQQEIDSFVKATADFLDEKWGCKMP